MDQRNESFVPHVLAITVGTVVDFPNSDHIYHNVFSLSKTKTFDLGRYAAGHSKPIRFDRPGIVRVFCDIHSHMNAFILVFNHPFFAMTDADGRYRIDNVPPGTYNVVAWKRQRGYATRALGLILPLARTQGLPSVELTTDVDNLPSQRVILHNGGQLVEQFHKPASHGGAPALRFRGRPRHWPARTAAPVRCAAR